MDNLIRQNPEIVHAYDTYRHCRNVVIVSHDVAKGDKTFTRTEEWPTGISIWPVQGGYEDQPYRLMEFFDEFMSAERHKFGT